MAKQIINFGAAANDGTGDPLRTAMQKVVANFDELYAGQFSGDYSDLTGIPAIPADLTDLGIADGTDGQVLTTDGSGGFTFEDAPGAGSGIALTDLSVTVATAGTANLEYDNTSGEFTYTPPIVPADLTDLGIVDGTVGQVLTTDGSGGFTFEDASGGGVGLSARAAKAGTTASIADGVTTDVDIAGFKSYALMTITTTEAAWVRVYVNNASRVADNGRAETSDPAPDAGVVAEVITAGAETVLISPGVIGYNLDSVISTNIPIKVTNKSGSAAAITVTLSVLQLEA